MENIENLIDWNEVLNQPRYAGGHEEVMKAIFGIKSEVIAWWSDNDYQGTVAIAHKLNDGRIVIMTDYYGSCSGCDAWDGASEEDARRMVHDLIMSAKVFENINKAINWIKDFDLIKEPWNYPFQSAKYLVGDLEKY